MKRKVILIQPYVGIFDTITLNIPQGLLAIARFIYKDYNVVIIDQRIKGWKSELLSELDNDVICAGITCKTGHQIFFASKIAQFIKKINNEIKIIFGGIHPSLKPLQTVKEDYIDFVVVGEGEYIFKELVDALASKKNPGNINGIAYKINGKSILNKDKTAKIKLDQLPEIPYHLVDIKEYMSLSAQNQGNALLIEGARGCVHNCIYCYNSTLNKKSWRPFSSENILNQIEQYNKKYNVDGFFIIDDSFFIYKRRVIEFINGIKNKNLKIKWCCEANLSDLIKYNDQELKMLEESGLDWIGVGIESGNIEIINKICKKIDFNELMEFNNKIIKFNIKIRYNFMAGYLWENIKSLKDTVQLCLKLIKSSPNIMVQALYVTVPFPGTKYLQECIKKGFKEPAELLGWSEFDSFSILKYMPWFNKKLRKKIETVMYSSFFIDTKVNYQSNKSFKGRIITFLGRLYRPIAEFKFKHLFHYFYIEKLYFVINYWILKKIKM